MRVIRGLGNLKPLQNGCVVTIGNFDGVHLGHQFVIENLAKCGQLLGLPVVVTLFEPQPLEYLRSQNAPSRLTRFREKVLRLTELPVDYVLVLRFDQLLAGVNPEDFIRTVLIDGLHAKLLLVGDDFRFGKDRQGDFALLKSVGHQAGFQVQKISTFKVSGHRVSSTSIRNALEIGDLSLASCLLGKPYSICGRIMHGEKRGRSIGFPTANIHLFRKNSAVQGVFAVTMSGIAEQEHPGVANVGVRPTIGGRQKVVLETHLFDFDGDIYGRYVEVHFQRKIRDEKQFESLESLRNEIEQDALKAKKILRSIGQLAS